MKPTLDFMPDGSVRIEYGDSMGAETFSNIALARQHIPAWCERRRKLIAKELEELKRLERDVWQGGK